MNNCTFYTCILIILLATSIYNVNKISDTYKKVYDINPNLYKCRKISTTRPMVPFVQIDNNTLISIEVDTSKLFFHFNYLYRKEQPANPKFIYLNIQTQEIKQLQVDNFTNTETFYSDGFKLLNKDTLYILVHTLYYGEKIYYFKIKRQPYLHLIHYKTFTFPLNYNGIIQDIILLNENTFYFSTRSLIGMPNELNYYSRLRVFLINIISFFSPLFDIKLSYLYLYSNGKITKIKKTEALRNGSKVYDKIRKIIFLVQMYEKKILVLQIENDLDNLNIIYEIKTEFFPGNLNYNEKNGDLTLSILGSFKEKTDVLFSIDYNKNINFAVCHGGIEIFNTFSNDFYRKFIYLKNDDLKIISSGLFIQNKIYFTSYYDNGYAICDNNN